MRLRTRLRAHGGVIGSIREYGFVHFVDRGLRLVWHRAGVEILAALRSPYRSRYGWLEALLVPSYDFWVRYAIVCRELAAAFPAGETWVLEVGSGPIGLSSFLSREPKRICMVDRSYPNVAGPQSDRVVRVCCDACQMPFEDGAFPIVLSLDTLEHIPRELRPAFLKELRRVAGRAVILTCPVDSSDNEFQARRCDSDLVEGLQKRGQPSARWPEEHLQQGHPAIEELRREFDGASVEGWQNADVWMRFQLFQSRPFVWLWAGFYYLAVLAHVDKNAPYYRALIVWPKPVTAPEAVGEVASSAV
jgi:methyltransferase family protein